jgi:hypothetical protein
LNQKELKGQNDRGGRAAKVRIVLLISVEIMTRLARFVTSALLVEKDGHRRKREFR